MRALLRAILLLIVVVAIGFLILGYWTGSRAGRSTDTAQPTVGTTGAVDVQRARERGAEIGERAAEATKKAGEALGEAALTSKIKAKMALDDNVKARAIDVTTSGSTVTLSGTVASSVERERAVRLARETAGVTQVVDNLRVRP
jgi:hyperosmotically inducible periplasmic protein